jgi:hypothetical protein
MLAAASAQAASKSANVTRMGPSQNGMWHSNSATKLRCRFSYTWSLQQNMPFLHFEELIHGFRKLYLSVNVNLITRDGAYHHCMEPFL